MPKSREFGTNWHSRLVPEVQDCASCLLMLKPGWAGPSAGPVVSSLLLEEKLSRLMCIPAPCTLVITRETKAAMSS